MRDINSMSRDGRKPWPKTGATQYHAQLRLLEKDRTIKGLVVCNSRDLEPWELLNSLALGCYQPSPVQKTHMYVHKNRSREETIKYFFVYVASRTHKILTIRIRNPQPSKLWILILVHN